LSSFETLGLSKYLLETLAANGFETPTPIQAQAIPPLLEGRDLIGLAQTGTGKTLGFGLPIVARLIKEGAKPDPKAVRALILAPTRELVNQIADSLKVFTRKSPLKITTVVGGASINVQTKILEKGIDILVATPGRLLDLANRKAINLTATRYLVLDEADQMLDLGFIHDLKKIVKLVPKRRQTMLFSATMPKAIAELAADYLDNPVEVSVTPPGKAADKISQQVHFVLGRDHKTVLLKEQLRANAGQSLIFCKTKHGAEKLSRHLDSLGFSVASIHGNKSQGQRDRALKAFRDSEIATLVATDVAARGIDVPSVSHVYNYDLPNVPESYVHRIGRTARAGREGSAIAFCGPEDIKMLYDIEKLMGIAIPVASGERPEWQGKKAKSGGEGHRGRRPESRGPREERERQEAQQTARAEGAEKAERKPRPQSSFAEVEELDGGEFRAVREDGRGSRSEHRNRGDRRDRSGQNADRPARGEHSARSERPAHGERRDGRGNPDQARKQRQGGVNRHAPARNAGFADDSNVVGSERSTEQRSSGRPQGKPQSAAAPSKAAPQDAKRHSSRDGGKPHPASGRTDQKRPGGDGHYRRRQQGGSFKG
jgi:ATP-dependent RNA helicase RhlE